MTELISKIQHDAYEKGEFSDEKPRSLTETLELIKNFPWDSERGHTDIQLTGPSVTILDEQGNYLKVALYFGGKHCLYYLDHHNHLYEFHTTTLDEVYTGVTNFFEGSLNLKDFDRQLFSVGNKAHFVNANFIYRVKFLRTLLYAVPVLAFICYFFFIFILGVGEKSNQIIQTAVLGMVGAIVSIVAILLIGMGLSDLGMRLHISKGNHVFHFGTSSKRMKEYNKDDVAEIVCPRGRRQGIDVALFTTNIIVLKNGDQIKLPSLLISKSTLINKFSDKMGNVKIPVIVKQEGSFRMFDTEINEGATK